MDGPKIATERFDVVLSAGLTAGLELETWFTGNTGPHRVATAAAGPAVTLAVAIRRRHPTAAGAVAALTADVLQSRWSSQSLAFAIAWMCNIYAATVWTAQRRFVALAALYVVFGALAVILGSGRSQATFFLIVSFVVIALVRNVIGEKERRARVAERERDVAAREAIVNERARIARELHDAIAHNVSVMVVQAGAERRTLDAGPTREVLETVEKTGRSALTEMRRLVGMLRTDEADPLMPQPGLGDLPKLIAQVTDAGLPVELTTEGDPRALPAGLDLSAYRIVQEALTNALKHAGDARAAVHVRYGEESLELEVVDDGVGAESRVESGGHGLVGMRERVALYGGRFDAGRRADGGFVVRVLLPTR